MAISFKNHTDSGDPTFIQSDEELTIVCTPGDRGRWLGDYLEPIKAGQELTLLAQARSAAAEDVCSTLKLIFWANEPGYVLHSSIHIGEICGTTNGFKNFIHKFVVPEGVKSLRIDLRAWAGPGTSIFRKVAIVEAEPAPPPPEPEDKMLTIDLNLETVTWRITASKESVTALHIPMQPATETAVRTTEET